MRKGTILLAALVAGASGAFADLARVRPPDTVETERAVFARRGALGADDYVATNIYPCASAYTLRRVTDGRLTDRAVNALDLAFGTVFSLPGESASPGFARGFLAVIDSDTAREITFTGAARLYTSDFGERIVAGRGTTVFSFIEIRPGEFIVEMRELTTVKEVRK